MQAKQPMFSQEIVAADEAVARLTEMPISAVAQEKLAALIRRLRIDSAVSLRLPQHLLDSIKTTANARYMPYQSLIKVWLREKLHT
jgi:predicted DNA binding CopG/RHH family protein